MTTTETLLFPKLEALIRGLNPETISENRKLVLQPLIEFIQSKITDNQAVRINFICTHNSRRSHLAQVWAQAISSYFSIKNVSCFSGGTKATALFPMVVKTLQDSGFLVKTISQNDNPIYSIKYADNEHPIIAFSKRLDDYFNPKAEFAAVMTCSEADEGCPFIEGAEVRVPITFEDPKAFDNTPKQVQKYQERSLQIATELFYIFSEINT